MYFKQLEEKFEGLKYYNILYISSGGRFSQLNCLNNSNFVRPDPGMGSNFLEGLRKLRLKLDSSSTFKTRIGLRLTHDSIYQTL